MSNDRSHSTVIDINSWNSRSNSPYVRARVQCSVKMTIQCRSEFEHVDTFLFCFWHWSHGSNQIAWWIPIMVHQGPEPGTRGPALIIFVCSSTCVIIDHELKNIPELHFMTPALPGDSIKVELHRSWVPSAGRHWLQIQCDVYRCTRSASGHRHRLFGCRNS